MTAILDKVAAGELLGRRQDMASNQLLSHALEQLLARSKRLRDTEAATINMQLVTWRDGGRERSVRCRDGRRAAHLAAAIATYLMATEATMRRLVLVHYRSWLVARPLNAQIVVYDPANTARNTITATVKEYLLNAARAARRSSGAWRGGSASSPTSDDTPCPTLRAGERMEATSCMPTASTTR